MSMNIVTLIGHVGGDPEPRCTPSGSKVVKFSLAVNDTWKNKQTGQKEQHTNWIDCEAWNKTAETIENYVRKGSKVGIEGSLQYREWQAQDGSKRSKISVKVHKFHFLDSKPKDGNQNSNHNPGYHGPGASGVDAEYQPPIDDDDIPF